MNTISPPPLQHKKLPEFLAALQRQTKGPIEAGVLLGSGLSALIDLAEVEIDLPFQAIEGYPPTRIPGHPGRLVIGRLGGKRCAMFVGRFHAYEGLTGDVLTLPVQVAAGMGATRMVLTTSVGGLNTDYQAGDVVFVRDHINMMGYNPLVDMIRDHDGQAFAANLPSPFVNPIRMYRQDLYDGLRERAAADGVNLHQGVLAAMLGPNYETPAEVRMLRAMGADIACMSTVPEALYAAYAGMNLIALAFVTNLANDGSRTDQPGHEQVLKAAAKGAAGFSRLVEEAVRLL